MPSTTAATSGLLSLVHGVRAWFTANNVTANVAAAGWKQRSQKLNQGPGQANRVLFIPGDLNGRAGTLGQPRIMSTNPRPLYQWSKLVTLCVWAVDTSDTNNEELQIAAVENLLESTVQAMRYAQDPTTKQFVGLANIEWIGDLTWTVDNTEMYFGREIQAQFIHKGPLYDVTYDTCTPQAAVSRDPIVP